MQILCIIFQSVKFQKCIGVASGIFTCTVINKKNLQFGNLNVHDVVGVCEENGRKDCNRACKGNMIDSLISFSLL